MLGCQALLFIDSLCLVKLITSHKSVKWDNNTTYFVEWIWRLKCSILVNSFCSSLKWKWSRLVVSDSLRPHGLYPTRLLCPWDFPGNSTGVDCHFLLQGIFPTQGSNPGLPHCRQTLYRLSHQESKIKCEDQKRLNSWLHKPYICYPQSHMKEQIIEMHHVLWFCVLYLQITCETTIHLFHNFPSGKESDCNARNTEDTSFYSWVGKIHWRRKWQPTPGFLPGKSHEQRSMLGLLGHRVRHSWVSEHALLTWDYLNVKWYFSQSWK